MASGFNERLRLIREFGEESLDGRKFRENLVDSKNNIDYFEIIELWFAAVSLWKKKLFLSGVRDFGIYSYRKNKVRKRMKELGGKVSKNSIVFFPISETNVMLFEPIIELFKKNKEPNYIFRYDYSLDGLKKEIEKRGFPYVTFENYLKKRKRSGIKKIRLKSLKVGKKIISKKKKYSILLPALEYYFGSRRRFYEIIDFVEGFTNFIESENPSMIILPDETLDIARGTSYLCKKFGVPCLVMQHGSITEEGAEGTETLAIKKIVFGKAVKDYLVKTGMDSRKIEVTGSPIYDAFSKKIDKKETERLNNKFDLRKNEKVILFASTGDNARARPRLESLFKALKEDKNLKLIIKQHPAEYYKKSFEEFYKSLARKNGVKIQISKDELRPLLHISNVFVTDFSTTILEALILRKPIILMNFEGEFKYENYPKFKGVIWHTNHPKDVSGAVSLALKSKFGNKEERFVEKLIKWNMYSADGHSAERISKLIKKYKLE